MPANSLLTAALVAALTVGSTTLAAAAASDPYRSQQWNVDRVEAPMAWELSRGAGTRVAVVDTGVDLEHPELRSRIARRADGSVLGRDFIDDDDDPSDENGHGTLVAGIIAAELDNGAGISGIAPGVLLMPIRVLDGDGQGDGSDVDAAIRWAVDNGAHVVNLSLESDDAEPRIELPVVAPTSAVQYAWDRGVVVVAALGNDGSTSDDYPESSPVVLVGATTRDDQRAGFSDTGRTDALMAPGVDIISTLWCDPAAVTPTEACAGAEEHAYAQASGTSFAAPHVSAALAILRATGLGHQAAVDRLRETARDLGTPGPDEETGLGLIDIASAAGAKNPPSSPPPSTSPSPRPTTSPSGSPSPAAPSPQPSPTGPGSAPPTGGATPSSPPATAPDDPSPADSPTEPEPTTAGDGASRSPSPSPAPAAGPGDPGSSPDGDGDPAGPLRLLAGALLLAATVGHVRVRGR